MNQQEQDKKLLELYDKCKYEAAIELGGRTITTQSLLEARHRISFQEGVEAERKRIDDLFCEWCMENEIVDESEAQNFRKLLTQINYDFRNVNSVQLPVRLLCCTCRFKQSALVEI